jgi:predicted transcriptional regulator of viral defense system
MRHADIQGILRFSSTVFSFKEVLLSFDRDSPKLLARRLHYYVSQGQLYPIRRGLYAKDKNYNRLELGTKIYTPAYISFETVLVQHGVVFQYYRSIFVATYQTKDLECDGNFYSFKKLKDVILFNSSGVENCGNYYIATKERAFLDILYLNKNYHFDNLRPLDYQKVLSLLPLYKNKRMERVVKQQFADFFSQQTDCE